jgi:chemotaxis protein methyltransferase CheR
LNVGGFKVIDKNEPSKQCLPSLWFNDYCLDLQMLSNAMAPSNSDIQETDIRKFQETISEYSAYDFGEYSINSLKRRLFKITKLYGADIHALIKIISNNPSFLEEVVKKLTVSTTELFRDPLVWRGIMTLLQSEFSARPAINIWHPGCSTGQEVYSMMILLDQLGLLEKSKIYASDINTDVMDTAQKGIYRLRFNREYIEHFNTVFTAETEHMQPAKFNSYEKYLTIDEVRDSITINDFLRKKPVYKKIDLVKDDNLFNVKFDLVICRNVILYFNNRLKNKVLQRFYKNICDHGVLVLGQHESIIGPCTTLFQKKELFYFKKPIKQITGG